MKAIFAVMNTSWAVVKIKPEKKSSLSAFQIYDFHVFTVVYSPLYGFIWNQHDKQLPVGLLAHLVENCTGIAEVMGSNFHCYSSSVHYTFANKFCISHSRVDMFRLKIWFGCLPQSRNHRAKFRVQSQTLFFLCSTYYYNAHLRADKKAVRTITRKICSRFYQNQLHGSVVQVFTSIRLLPLICYLYFCVIIIIVSMPILVFILIWARW